jgi:hypothetical protein
VEQQQLIAETERIIRDSQRATETVGPLAEARELVRVTAGEKSAFYKALMAIDQNWNAEFSAKHIDSALRSYISFLKTGLVGGVSLQRQAQLDVVSDILEQAQQLLETKGIHPAAPTVLIGASLEEFLRTWVEEAGLSIGNRRPGIDAYSSTLRDAELISKQDAKDIVSWAGARNHAAHGEWEELGDAARIRLMLEGVNLFMRKYS